MPNRPLLRTVAALAAVTALAGCSGTTLLRHNAPPPAPRTHTGRLYLTELTATQSRLAAAEQAIPHSPRTPAQLARSIALLARAIHNLAGDLTAIKPPREVASLHRKLIVIASQYEQRLSRLVGQARVPTKEVAAANAMANDTELASVSFTTTSATIRQRLAAK
jgi:septal ring factor EnvC (AmiA/AmiB activator)